MFGLDYVTAPPIASLQAAGATFACRYTGYFAGYDLSTIATPQGKVLSPGEAKTLSQAGMALVSNYEWYANRALESAASGMWDAQTAQKIHAACGGPADRPIYFSVDCDCAGAQTADYFTGVASVIGLQRTGAYGSYRVIKWLLDNHLITWAWQTYAWSLGQWDARAHIQQYQNGVDMDGHSVDYNRAMQPDFGQWFYGGVMQPYSEHAADFGAYFLATDAEHWKCTKTGKTVQFGLKTFYASLSMDGNTLPVVGLPLSDELYLTVNGKQVTLQCFERAGIYYDPAHVKDKQPGTGACSLCHLTDIDFLKNIPGLTLPLEPVAIDTTALVAAINAIADGIAPLVATALVEAKRL
jgi:hypothetical protein